VAASSLSTEDEEDEADDADAAAEDDADDDDDDDDDEDEGRSGFDDSTVVFCFVKSAADRKSSVVCASTAAAT
jgi:hypothetical protein